MKVAYFDCFSGASGDMIVGALLDAGLELEALRGQLAKLPVGGYSVRAEKVRRGGLAGTKFTVDVGTGGRCEAARGQEATGGEGAEAASGKKAEGASGVSAGAGDHGSGQPRRGLGDIEGIIRSAGLSARATAAALAVFRRLAEAEAKVHGLGVQEVHFHEVGAVDSLVDIVAACVGLDLLGVQRVYCSAIPAGSGTVRTAHGVLPVPAPGTLELLRGARVAGAGPGEGGEGGPAGAAGELTTPTGAAVLTTLAEGYGPPPEMELSAVGYGAGTRDGGTLPNLLRVWIGTPTPDGTADAVVELSANLDDCTGQVIAAALEKLLEAGCADAWAAPIYMKKSRPAWMVSALCSPAEADRMEAILLAETTTLGVRRRTCARRKLARRHVTVETPYGPIRVKAAALAEGAPALTASPEFADCAAAAEAHGVPVKEVLAAAVEAYRRAGT